MPFRMYRNMSSVNEFENNEVMTHNCCLLPQNDLSRFDRPGGDHGPSALFAVLHGVGLAACCLMLGPVLLLALDTAIGDSIAARTPRCCFSSTNPTLGCHSHRTGLVSFASLVEVNQAIKA